MKPAYVRELTEYPVGRPGWRCSPRTWRTSGPTCSDRVGLFGLAIRVMILFLLILAPTITTVTGSWERWLVIALICNAALIPAVFLVGGAWRRTPAPTAPEPVAAAHT